MKLYASFEYCFQIMAKLPALPFSYYYAVCEVPFSNGLKNIFVSKYAPAGM